MAGAITVMGITAIPLTTPTTMAGTGQQNLLAGPLTMATPATIMVGEEITPMPTPTTTTLATGVIPTGITRTTTPIPTTRITTNPATPPITRTRTITRTTTLA